jgi:fucose 4-O-acetylase-like acetyltransferase
MNAAQTTLRLHYFDYLRVFAVFIGLCFHAAMPFTTAEFYYWYVKSNNTSVFIDNILMLAHIYYMPLFFLIAGYFSSQIYQKYSWRGLIHNRASRIGLPFLILMLILIPLHTQDVFYFIYNQQLSHGIAIPTGPAFAGWITSQIRMMHQSGDLWRFYNNNGAYWFLYYLLWYYVIALLLEWMIYGLNKILSDNIKQKVYFIFTIIYLNPLVIGMILFGLLSYSQIWYLAISYKFLPPLHIILFYAVFFLMGWFMQRQNSIETCTKHCVIYFLTAICIFLPIFYMFHVYNTDYGNPHYTLYKMASLFFYSLIGSYLIFSTIGLTIRYLNKDNPVIRYLANSSYWLYISQIPVVLFAQIIIVRMNWPMIIQFSCTLLFSIIVLLPVYQYMVRHTWIGQLLNGTKHPNEF